MPDNCVDFCLLWYACVWFVECVFEMNLWDLIPAYYSIFLYEGINLLFQFMYVGESNENLKFVIKN